MKSWSESESHGPSLLEPTLLNRLHIKEDRERKLQKPVLVEILSLSSHKKTRKLVEDV